MPAIILVSLDFKKINRSVNLEVNVEIRKIYPNTNDLINAYNGNVKFNDNSSEDIKSLIPGTFTKVGVANGYLNVYAIKYGDVKTYVGYIVI